MEKSTFVAKGKISTGGGGGTKNNAPEKKRHRQQQKKKRGYAAKVNIYTGGVQKEQISKEKQIYTQMMKSTRVSGKGEHFHSTKEKSN